MPGSRIIQSPIPFHYNNHQAIFFHSPDFNIEPGNENEHFTLPNGMEWKLESSTSLIIFSPGFNLKYRFQQ
ncbi:MAG: hypothetical protein FD181_13 [Prolixibacteraceae bacterium]|nr:MAG: hypothetical protein FD181_13 [Prolixibacteraceae bacterium]